MCRGGKDGKTIRCKGSEAKTAAASLRKKIKYRADKENLSVEEWKNQNPEALSKLLGKSCSTVASAVQFQPVTETRKLPEGVPASITEHIKVSSDHIDATLTPDERKALSGYTGFAAGVANTVLLDGEIKETTLYDKAPPWRETTAPCDFSTREDLVDYLETMDSVLSERSDTQRVLYRGIPIYSPLHEEIETAIGKKIDVNDTAALMEGLQEFYKPGKVFHYPAYISTTHSAYQAADRTDNHVGTKITYYDSPEVKGIMFEMKTNAGLDITGASRNHSYEREVVLPRDSHYRVESIALRPEKYDTVSGYDYIKHPEELEEGTFTNLAVVVQMVEVDKDGNEITHTEPHKPSPLKLK